MSPRDRRDQPDDDPDLDLSAINKRSGTKVVLGASEEVGGFNAHTSPKKFDGQFYKGTQRFYIDGDHYIMEVKYDDGDVDDFLLRTKNNATNT